MKRINSGNNLNYTHSEFEGRVMTRRQQTLIYTLFLLFFNTSVIAATVIPTVTGSTELFRYPHVQTESSTNASIVWGTASSGTAELQYMVEGSGSWTTVSAAEQPFLSVTTDLGVDFYQQVATLDGLSPGTKYRYNILHNGILLAEDVELKTLPGAASDEVSFIVLGDSGVEYSEPRLVRDRIASRNMIDGDFIYPHDFVVGVGDIAYYSGTHFEFDYRFFDQMSGKGDRGDGLNSILSTRPFLPALGNHEYGLDPDGEPTAYLDSFVLPEMAGIPAADNERYYSVDAGNAHIVVIDSMKFDGNTDAHRVPEMLAWLDADLAATDRTWRVVFFHHTIFSVGNHGTWGDIRENNLLRQMVAPIMQQHGVQLVVFGHDHLYQRSKRILVDADGLIVRGPCNGVDSNVVESNAGIVYIVAGIGGTDFHTRQVDPAATCGSAEFDQYVSDYGDGYDFVAFNGPDPVIFDGSALPPTTPAIRHGFVRVSTVGQNLTVNAYNYDGELFDTYTMSSDINQPPALNTTFNPLSPQAVDTPITISTNIINGNGQPYEYYFQHMQGGVWVMLQDYSASNTASWTPTEADSGNHLVRVWARNVGSSAAFEVAEDVYFTVNSNLPDPGINNEDSSNGDSGACFIATAAYGSYLDSHVEILRTFRDNILLTNSMGKLFVEFYYEYSPPIADYIAERETLRLVTRLVLTPLVFGVKYPIAAFSLLLFMIGFVLYYSGKKYSGYLPSGRVLR